MQDEIEVPTDHGAMGAWVSWPEGGDGRAVLVLMEAFGVNAHIRSVCDRFAAAGYVALAPDLYHRGGRFPTAEYDDLDTAMEHFGRLQVAHLEHDLTAAFELLAGLDQVDAERVAAIGFCLGGYAAVLAACRTQPAVVAGFYGAGLATRREGSPLEPLTESFSSIECPVHLFYGGDDPVIPAAEVRSVEAALASAGVVHTVQVYDGAGHGFFCDARGSFVPDVARMAWQRVTEAFDVALGGAADAPQRR